MKTSLFFLAAAFACLIVAQDRKPDDSRLWTPKTNNLPYRMIYFSETNGVQKMTCYDGRVDAYNGPSTPGTVLWEIVSGGNGGMFRDYRVTAAAQPPPSPPQEPR